MGRQLGKLNNSTHPVGLGHQHGGTLPLNAKEHATRIEGDQTVMTNHLSTYVVAMRTHTRTEREKREADYSIPSRHRHAGPVAVAPLQCHTPSDRVESPNPDLTPAASQSPPRKHNARGPRHTRRWTPPRSRRHVEDIARRGLATSASVLRVSDSYIKSPSG